MSEPARASIQERFFAGMACFGCGPANAKGLRLRSFEAADGAVHAEFRPWPEHDNGLGFLNGGIIATVLDCHSAAMMIITADQRGQVADGILPYVTAGLDVSYLRPSPLHEAVELRARPTAADEATILVDAELWWQGKVRATARATWKRWRSRSPGPTTH